MSIIRDGDLAFRGQQKIDWVYDSMKVLKELEKSYEKTQPFRGKTIAMSIHMEAKTARLALLLKKLGARVYVTGCNTLSTQDDVAAALAKNGVEVFAIHGASSQEYREHLKKVLEPHPELFIDDGGDLFSTYCGLRGDEKWPMLGGCEETTTGITRLKQYEKHGSLPFPMINVNDADCKHLYDNVYGTGQSTIDAIMHTTNNVIASKTVVIAGYGYCGRGIAKRMRGMGARIIITEINPVRAIEAKLEGFEVMTMLEAASIGDFFITATGCKDVITNDHFLLMKNNAILCNSGHFDVEINLKDLARLSSDIYPRRENITGYKIVSSGRTINVLAEGKLVNLAAGNGHPAEIMDTSFAIQTLGLMYLIANAGKLEPKLHAVPTAIDERVARLKLGAMGVTIDHPTPSQREYLGLD